MMSMTDHQFAYNADYGGNSSSAATEQRIEQLENELRDAKRDMSDLRRQLASKTVQLARRAQAMDNEKENTNAKDRQILQLNNQLHQLEAQLASKDDELDEMRRLYTAQKKAARDALEAAAEREAALRYAEDSSRTDAEDVVGEEMERLTRQLALVQAKAQLQVQAKDAELLQLRDQLAHATHNRKAAVAEAEAALSEAWKAEGERERVRLEGLVQELQQELQHRSHAETQRQREEQEEGLPRELVEANKAKVQVQREFEAFREMTSHTLRQKQEEVARLLQENATMQARLAAIKAADLLGSSRVADEEAGPHRGPSTFDSFTEPWLHRYLPPFLRRLDRERRGVLPVIVVLAAMFVILMVAIIRAAASAHQQEGGGLCFLAKLGVNIGRGCGPKDAAAAVGKQAAKIIEQTPRVKDLPSGGKALRHLMWGLE